MRMECAKEVERGQRGMGLHLKRKPVHCCCKMLLGNFALTFCRFFWFGHFFCSHRFRFRACSGLFVLVLFLFSHLPFLLYLFVAYYAFKSAGASLRRCSDYPHLRALLHAIALSFPRTSHFSTNTPTTPHNNHFGDFLRRRFRHRFGGRSRSSTLTQRRRKSRLLHPPGNRLGF